jgi:hypothetical protein
MKNESTSLSFWNLKSKLSIKKSEEGEFGVWLTQQAQALSSTQVL